MPLQVTLRLPLAVISDRITASPPTGGVWTSTILRSLSRTAHIKSSTKTTACALAEPALSTAAVATAIATFASEIVGEEVFPREIDLGEYSLILDKRGKFAGFIACKYPTNQIHRGLDQIMAHYKPDMEYDEISKLIDNYLPYGLPIKDASSSTVKRIIG